MWRNLLIFVASVAMIAALFGGYALLVRDPGAIDAEPRDVLAELPRASAETTAPTLDVGAGRVPGGGGVELTLFDDRSGRATDRLRVADWQPVSGAKNEIEVTRPELGLTLPSGMTATITADRGRLTAERVQRENIRPKFGTLTGNAAIVIDRNTQPDRPPAAQRPEDIITIRMTALEFDLDLGRLKCDARVEVDAEEFGISGSGMHLNWNQADNVVDTLRIEQGEELRVRGGGALFDRFTAAPAAPAAAPAAQSAAIAATQRAARSPRKIAPKRTTYLCALEGGVTVRHERGAETIGRLEATELRMLFDVGGDRTPGLARGPASRPATQPADQERLVIRWSGPLTMTPQRDLPPSAQARRRIEALGSPLRLESRDGAAVCGRLELHDETGQIWLQPTPGGQVDFRSDATSSAAADSVYIDRRRNVVKLLGSVSLRSQRDARRPPFTLRCSQWAELHLADAAAPGAVPEAPRPAPGDGAPGAIGLGLGRLRSGLFVGDVRVNLNDQRLSCSELRTEFADSAAASDMQAALRKAVAIGGVRLAGDGERLDCGRLTLAFAIGDDGESYPHEVEAFGAVRVERGTAVATAEQMNADLTPVRKSPQPAVAAGSDESRQTYALQNLTLTGHAALRDPESGVAARGDWIGAVFGDGNRLARATVSSVDGRDARVYARPYSVRAPHIVLDGEKRRLRVDGRARLSFQTSRSLQGVSRAKAAPVSVTATRSLDIDGRGNTVTFVGDVVALSGEESLRADRMTLYLEDVQTPANPGARRGPRFGILQVALSAALRGQSLAVALREAAAGGDTPGGRGSSSELLSDGDARGGRKEPLRLVAENAVLASETFEARQSQPVTQMSVAAPLLTAEIPQRIIRTTGETKLFVTNYRLTLDPTPAAGSAGLPSALVSRGPSQTAMRAASAMTYVLGPAGPERRDSILFEGDVFFVHRAGREMVDFERLMPQLKAQPELLNAIETRNTQMSCQRLEGELLADGQGESGAGLRPGGARGLRLNWLIATGSVYLRDARGPAIRSVQAARAEFDRNRSTVLVSGDPTADARVFFENRETNELAQPAIGKAFEIDLERNTVKAGATRGEFSRP